MSRRASDQGRMCRGRGSRRTALGAALALLACIVLGQTKTPAELLARQPKQLKPLRAKGEKPSAKAARGKKGAEEDAAPVAAADDDWPMGGYDAGNTYYNSAEKNLKPPLLKIWESKLPNVGAERVSVSSGVVLAAGLGGKVFGNNNHVMALDARNGRSLWGFTLPGSEHAMEVTPACDGGLAFFGGQKNDNLYAVDLRTGAARWQHGGMKSMHYSPVVAAGGLLFANSDSGLWALDAQTGGEKWHANNTRREGVRESAVRSGKVLQPRTGALDAATGAPLWSNDHIAHANLVAANDELVFVVAKDRVAALEMTDGKTRWEIVPKAGAIYNRFLLVEDVLYAAIRRRSIV